VHLEDLVARPNLREESAQAKTFFFLNNVHRAPSASHGELNQPSPQFQADRPQPVKVCGCIEGQPKISLSGQMPESGTLVLDERAFRLSPAPSERRSRVHQYTMSKQ
jgi:hypothetical protein